MPFNKALGGAHSSMALGCPGRWAMEAIAVMTNYDDAAAEMHDLDQAMRASLNEAEEQKSKEKCLDEYRAEELAQHFKGSLLLSAVRLRHESLPHFGFTFAVYMAPAVECPVF
jgi:hypothetical protein